MLILFVLLVLFVVGVIWARQNDGIVPFFIMMLSGIALFGGLIALPIQHMGVNANVAEFRSIQTTVTKARERGDKSLENAALQHKIVEANAELANAQYWNKSIFGLWIPDVVDELKPIE